MNETIFEIGIIFLLLVINGIFAMTEIAMVSVRRERLRQRADAGDPRARAALELADNPNRFLSTVQIGITLVGVVAGVYGGARLAEDLAVPFARIPGVSLYAEEIALTLVVSGITFLSLIVGELVPKRIGMAYAEAMSCLMARPMLALSRLAHPLVRVLGWSTDAVLNLMPVKTDAKESVTDDEVRGLMQEGLRAGAFHRVESEIVSNVLDLDNLIVRDIMTPRPQIIWINKADSHELIWHKIVVSRHSQFPVYEHSRDNVVGLLSVKALYANLAAGAPVNVADLMTKPFIVPESQPVLKLLEAFRQTGHHAALVADEFGGISGLVTLIDVMESVLGDLQKPDDRSRPDLRLRSDGTWLADALVDIERVEEKLPEFHADPVEERDYQTLAGFLVKQFGHVPREGERTEYGLFEFEVLDMDLHRIDKVLISKRPTTATPPAEPSGEAI